MTRHRIVYLLNQYPNPTQTFIRREMAALEGTGWQIERYSIRPAPDGVVDTEDLAELDRTRVILDERAVRRLVSSAIRTFGRRPRSLLRAVRQAWILGGGGNVRRRLVSLAHLAEACVVAEWCQRDGVRHIHTHFGTNGPSVALLAGCLSDTTFSFTVHGPDEFDRPEALNLREKVAAAAFVVAISSFGRSQVLRWSDAADWGKVKVVRCGVDAQFLEVDITPPVAARRFVCVGRLSRQKGPLLLVEAVARLRDSNRPVEVVMIGDGHLRPLVEEAVAAAGVVELITLAGWRDGPSVRAELANSRGLVLASFAEGLPVVIMEALALGRPVVTTAIAGIPELVDEDCGWVIPAGSVDALVDALADAASAPVERLEAMGKVGRERVREMHDVNSEAEALASLFAQAVAAPEGAEQDVAATRRRW